jgi:sugar/nucleoside kinase (ribokinase family)
MSQPAYVCIGCVIIDDIVFPDGETRMGVLGGGSTHAAAGMVMWGKHPGLFTYIGHDVPEAIKERLRRAVDQQGLISIDQPQIRAWQIFEWDGKRIEIFRIANPDVFLVGPPTESVPADYRKAKGIHLLDDAARIPQWRALFPDAVLMWEPPPPYMAGINREHFCKTVKIVDIVSPNLLEARLLYGHDEPSALVRAMLADGAKIAALRMGEAGSLVGTQGSETLLDLPAVPVPAVIDQTGAGNAYCGAFLVGWVETGNVRTAARYAGVAASFTLEVVGVPEPPPDLEQVRAERSHWLDDHIVSRALP